MRIDNKIASSHVNGPGDRSVIWVNGCTLGCKGCWNPETHAIDVKKEVHETELIDWILENAKDGVTFSGGEPIQQLADLAWIMERLRANSPSLSIGMYTGYSLKELEEGKIEFYYPSGTKSLLGNLYNIESWKVIKRNLDFAIMGRFNEQQLDTTRPYCSSKNQNIHLFSDRYSMDDFGRQEIEFHIDEEGLVQITGFPVGLPEIQDMARDW